MKIWLEERITRPFLHTMRTVPWFGPVISSVIVALLINTLSTTLTEIFGLWGAWLVMFILASILIGFVFYYTNIGGVIVLNIPSEIPTPAKHRGLIFIYSKNDPVLDKAVEYHRPILDHCWLLVTAEMKEDAIAARSRLTDSGLVVEPVDISSSFNLMDCYEATVRIHKSSLIPSHTIIADMTGGTKPMSVGVFLACHDHGYPLQHVAARFDETSKKAVPALPIEIRFTRQSQ